MIAEAGNTISTQLHPALVALMSKFTHFFKISDGYWSYAILKCTRNALVFLSINTIQFGKDFNLQIYTECEHGNNCWAQQIYW